MMHRTAPSNRELPEPNIVMPGLRNSANLEINYRVLGHMEFTVLQGKLPGKQRNCVDVTGEVMGVPIISPLEGGSATSLFMALQEDSFLERSRSD